MIQRHPSPFHRSVLYSEQSHDHMAAQAVRARGQDGQGKPECQRVINARNSFLSGGAATGERSSHPTSAHAEEMQRWNSGVNPN
jgi:hypothetical protein